MGRAFEGGLNGSGLRVGIIVARFNELVTEQRLARGGRYDAIICLGAVIRGATAHFDYVAAGVAQGIGRVALESGVPVIFGVLTTETIEQALERAGTKQGNKGWDAAQTAVEMANVLRAIGE